jgi:hypothetical protein
MLSQGDDVLLAGGCGRPRDKFRKLAERLFSGRELRPQIIVLDVLGQLRVPSFLTEILPVRFDSIEAVVRPGDHRSQHLALGARQSGRSVHCREI